MLMLDDRIEEWSDGGRVGREVEGGEVQWVEDERRRWMGRWERFE